jgi:hypothetical protein
VGRVGRVDPEDPADPARDHPIVLVVPMVLVVMPSQLQ